MFYQVLRFITKIEFQASKFSPSCNPYFQFSNRFPTNIFVHKVFFKEFWTVESFRKSIGITTLFNTCSVQFTVQINPRTSKGGGGGGGIKWTPPIGFSDLKLEAFKQSKWNFQHLICSLFETENCKILGNFVLNSSFWLYFQLFSYLRLKTHVFY